MKSHKTQWSHWVLSGCLQLLRPMTDKVYRILELLSLVVYTEEKLFLLFLFFISLKIICQLCYRLCNQLWFLWWSNLATSLEFNFKYLMICKENHWEVKLVKTVLLLVFSLCDLLWVFRLDRASNSFYKVINNFSFRYRFCWDVLVSSRMYGFQAHSA